MTTPNESRQFDRLAQRCGASEEGAAWLKGAVDPFHDVDLRVEGFPDASPGRSIIYDVRKNVTISAPSGATGRWDCHISSLPLVSESELESYDVALGASGSIQRMTYNSSQPTLMPDFISACAVPEGQATFRGGTGEVYDNISFSDVLDTDGSSLFRLVGAAFEIHNVTEELHKSGAVTVYRQDTNQDRTNVTMTTNSGLTVLLNDGTTMVRGPPINEADAKILNGITWEAAEGCLVPVIVETDNPPQKFTPTNVVMATGTGANTRYVTDSAIDTKRCRLAASTVTSPTADRPCVRTLPIMNSGAYFTGLANETSLVLTVRAFVEVFPTAGNPLVALAHPSPSLDQRALQCYGEIMSELHPGYMVRDNAAGDFFRKALSVMRSTVLPITKVVAAAAPPGVVKQIASAAAGGMQAVDDAVPKKNQKKK